MKSSKYKLLVVVLFPCFLFILGIALCCKKSPGFSVSKISSNLPHHPDGDIEPVSLDPVLSQKFTYLAKGTQSYAFVSEDQKYVLKFFKMRHFIPQTWLRYIPLPLLNKYRWKKIDKREKRLKTFFTTLKTCYENYKEEAGLIAVHLNPTKALYPRVILVDSQGKEWPVDLNQVVFVLQEKAETIHDLLPILVRKGETQKIDQMRRSLLDLVARRCQKGFIDEDKGIADNYGFVGERLIQIDIGWLVQDENIKDHVEEEVQRIKNKLEGQIQHLYLSSK
jgi:hypothetical protein